MKKLLLLLFLSNALFCFAQDDVLLLKSGQKIKCEIISIRDSMMLIKMYENNFNFNLKTIDFYKMNNTWFNSDGTVRASLNDIANSDRIFTEKTIRLQDQVDYMRKNLRQSHYFFTTGIILGITGTLVSLFSTVEGSEGLLIFGSGVSSVGMIFMLTSHHFIGQAGAGIGGRGVVVKYTF